MILQRIDAFPLLAVETKQRPVFPAVYVFITMGKRIAVGSISRE
jgi:hypothetical protein